MKKASRYVFTMLLFFTMCICFHTVPAKAASVKKVATVDTYRTRTATFRRDLTGDGKAEKITVTAKDGSYDYYKQLVVSVNGKTAAVIKPQYSFFRFEVRYLSMSSRKFLILTASTDNYDEVLNAVYRYNSRTKKLVRVLDFNFKYATSHSYETITKATSNTITVHYTSQYHETGYIAWDFVYSYKNGSFKLKSKQANVKTNLGNLTMGDGYDKYFHKNQFKTARSLTFYTSASLSKKSYIAKKGTVLTLKKIYVSGGKVYLSFSQNGKTGWIRIGNPYSSVYRNSYINGWFYGTGRRLVG